MNVSSLPVLSAPLAPSRLCVESNDAAPRKTPRLAREIFRAFASATVALLLLATVVTAQTGAPPAGASDQPEKRSPMTESKHDEARQTLVISITIFVLAIFIGFELISKVPATLHTPLMSGSNAISGITVVGAIIAAGAVLGATPILGFAATVLAMINVVGGFLVTHRMLRMFKRR
jgi:NAD(P) transhydrogenase subunit alpha